MIGAIDPLIQVDHPRRLRVIDVIEKKQLHCFTLLREETKVHPLRVLVAPSGKLLPQLEGAASFVRHICFLLPHEKSPTERIIFVTFVALWRQMPFELVGPCPRR